LSKIKQSKIDGILARREVSLVSFEETEGDEVWQVASQTDKSKSYMITINKANTFECECPSFKYDVVNDPQTCKHCEAVKQFKVIVKDDFDGVELES